MPQVNELSWNFSALFFFLSLLLFLIFLSYYNFNGLSLFTSNHLNKFFFSLLI